jgi:hypothetical protein
MHKVGDLEIENGILLYESKYSRHIYQAETEIMFSDWSAKTKNMDAQDFKTEMEAWLAATKECKFTYLFDRCVEFNYTISLKEQVWMANLLNEAWATMGLKKYAHIVPEAFISSLSVEQTFEEYFNMKLPNQYPIKDFADANEALDWLKSKS